MRRVLDSIAYSVTGLVLATALVYGWRQLTAPPPMPAVPPLAETAMPPLPAAPVTAVQQTTAQPAPAPTPPAAVPAPGAAAEDVYAQERARFYELQKGCDEAAANNRNGEYPSLQAMACDRYAQFAAARGWQPVTLPAYGQAPAAPPQPEEPALAEQPTLQDQSQVIQLAPGYYGGGYGNGVHHHRPQPLPAETGRPQQQIGPNFTPPPPQQPPPVSQRQSSRMVRAGPQN